MYEVDDPDNTVSPDLEVLRETTHLFIKQFVEESEALLGFETSNKYEIVNSLGERVFFAVETTNCCLVCCCKTSRPFSFKVLDYVGKEVMKIERPCSITCCCTSRICCCGLFSNSKIEMRLPNEDDKLIGVVEESCHPFSPRYTVKDGAGVKKLKIKGPDWVFCCNCKLLGNVEFEVHALDGAKAQCGRISKEFDDVQKEDLRSDADNYGICFPKEMAIWKKATLLGAVLLIDFTYFEDDQGKVTARSRDQSAAAKD